MRDIDNYLGKKAYTAKATTLADLTDGKGNFDFGVNGNLGYFSDVFIVCHFSASAMTANDTLTISVKDSADGTTWVERASHAISGAYVAGDKIRVKLPVVHKRFMKVMTSYNTDSTTPNAVTVEFYLERG